MSGSSAAGVEAVFNLILLQQAGRYDLADKAQRRLSRDRLATLFCNLQMAIRPDLTLEIGAFDATFSARMAKAGIPAFAFEANPYNFRRFHEALTQPSLPIDYRHSAISDADGEVSFEIRKSVDGQALPPDRGNNSLLRRGGDQGAVEYETVTVPSLTLKTFLWREKLEESSFSAWIDVEGALSRVIGGAGTVFGQCQSVMVELEERAFWQGQMLADEAMGWFVGQGFVPVARDFESRYQYNVVFLRDTQMKAPAVRQVLVGYLQRSP